MQETCKESYNLPKIKFLVILLIINMIYNTSNFFDVERRDYNLVGSLFNFLLIIGLLNSLCLNRNNEKKILFKKSLMIYILKGINRYLNYLMIYLKNKY